MDRVLDLKPRGRRVEPHRCHCVVSLSKNINPSLVLVQLRKTHPFITERLLMGLKESNQTNVADVKSRQHFQDKKRTGGIRVRKPEIRLAADNSHEMLSLIVR